MKLITQKNFDYAQAVQADKDLINEFLERHLEVRYPQMLWESIRYSVLGEGKRIRPILLLETTRVCGGNTEHVLPTAAALEMLHAQSLIHDDLPCMDNDDYRRGKLTNHKAYGEALAILAGDALLAYAPNIIVRQTPEDVNKQILLKVLDEFLTAAGPLGIVGGQAVDIESESREIDFAAFNYILAHKTGELFKFAMRAGALFSEAPEEIMSALSFYGKTIGYAFQIADDILDVTETFETLGKTPGKDEKAKKNTHVSLYGLDDSKRELEILCINAQQKLVNNDIKSPLLMAIAEQIAVKALK